MAKSVISQEVLEAWQFMKDFWRWMEQSAAADKFLGSFPVDEQEYERLMSKYIKGIDSPNFHLWSSKDLTEEVPEALRARFDEAVRVLGYDPDQGLMPDAPMHEILRTFWVFRTEEVL